MSRLFSLYPYLSRVCLVIGLILAPAFALGAKSELLKACLAGDVEQVKRFIHAAAADQLACMLTTYPGVDAFGVLNKHACRILGPLNCMQIAAAKGFDELVSLLKAHGVNPEVANIKGFTPLHLAGRFGAESTVNRLLEYSVDINARDCRGYTPLLTALEHQQEQVAQTLANNGADLFIAADDDTSAVHLAAVRGYKSIIASAIDRQVPLNITDDLGQTPLLLAARHGHLAVVKQLLSLQRDKAVNRDSRDKTGRTPLMWAAINNHATVIKELIYKGAVRTLSDKENDTALTLAVRHGQLEAVNALLERAGWKYLYGMHGPQALAMAIQQKCVEIEKALVQAGVERNSADALGVDRLYHAAVEGLEHQVEGLILTGAEVDGHGELNPLTAAVRNGHVDVVETLLRYGARPEWGGRELTPLMEAVHVPCKEEDAAAVKTTAARIVALLVEYGARVDRVEPKTGQTSLCAAVAAGKSDVVQELLDQKANPKKKNGRNLRPIDIAAENRDVQTVRMLQRYSTSGVAWNRQGGTHLSQTASHSVRKYRKIEPVAEGSDNGSQAFSIDSLDQMTMPVITATETWTGKHSR